MFVFGTL